MFFLCVYMLIYAKILYIDPPQKIMRLTKRDMALTKISIPAAIQSVYFRGKRYQYSDYLKIIKQANKNESSKLDS